MFYFNSKKIKQQLSSGQTLLTGWTMEKRLGAQLLTVFLTLRNHFILTVRGFYHTFFINNFSGRFLKILKCPDLLYNVHTSSYENFKTKFNCY